MFHSFYFRIFASSSFNSFILFDNDINCKCSLPTAIIKGFLLCMQMRRWLQCSLTWTIVDECSQQRACDGMHFNLFEIINSDNLSFILKKFEERYIFRSMLTFECMCSINCFQFMQNEYEFKSHHISIHSDFRKLEFLNVHFSLSPPFIRSTNLHFSYFSWSVSSIHCNAAQSWCTFIPLHSRFLRKHKNISIFLYYTKFCIIIIIIIIMYYLFCVIFRNYTHAT